MTNGIHIQLDTVGTISNVARTPQPSTPTATLQALYMTNYGALHTLVYDTDIDDVLSPMDGESILALLSEALPTYKRRALTQRAYIRWATAFVVKEAHRFVNTLKMRKAHHNYIQAAIYREMPEFVFDNSLQMGDLEQEIAIQIFANAEDLADIDNPKNTAKQSTRIYGVAKKHIHYYFSGKMSDRLELLLARKACGDTVYGDIETISKVEYKAMKAAYKRNLTA